MLVCTSDSIISFYWCDPIVEAINHGVRLALSTGSIKGAEVVNIHVKLHDLQLNGSISPALYSAAASDCVRVCLRHGDCTLLQPMMRVEVSVRQSPLLIPLCSSRSSA